MGRCAIVGCQNSVAMGYNFYEISKKRRKQWLKICGLPESTPKYARLCEGHFSKDQFDVVDSLGSTKLKSCAVPDKLAPNPAKLLKRKAVTPYKLDRVEDDGSHVFVSEGLHIVRTISFDDGPPERPPLESISNFENNALHSKPTTSKPKETKEELQRRVEFLEDAKQKLEVEYSRLENENTRLSLQVNKLEESTSQYVANCDGLFNPDQMKLLALSNKSGNSRKWSPETIKKAIRVRLIAKARGYEKLRLEEKWPLPSLCAVNRRLQRLDCVPGAYEEVVNLLSEKILQESDVTARFALLSIDEMSCTPRVEYDKGLKSYIGFVSPEIARDEAERASIANHCMAVVVRGLTVHWKQLVSYVLTGSSVSPLKLGIYLDRIITALHERGIIVLVVSSDMGSCNQGLWSLKGVKCNRKAVEPCAPHPCPSDDVPHLLYSPDVPHLVKNTWAQLLRTSFVMSQAWAQKNNLKSRLVSVEHVKKIVEVQGTTGLRLVPNLKEVALEPSKFDKMRVPVALSFFNEKLGKSVILLAQKGLIPNEAETTGIFIVQFAKWYSIMSSRDYKTGLRNNARGLENVTFLKEFMVDISEMIFLRNSSGQVDSRWKPIQSGILLSTKVVLHLWEKFVVPGTLKYLLTSRFFTSGCENLFSQLRGYGDMHPPPVKLRHVIRLISVAQYLRASKLGCYEDDDEPYYLNFLDGKSLKRTEDWVINEDEIDEVLDMPYEELTQIARMGLYYVAGWVVFRLKGGCATCNSVILSDGPLPNLPSDFTEAVSRGALSHPSYLVWSVVLHIEDIVLQKGKDLLFRKNVKEFLVACSKKRWSSAFAGIKCHDILELIASKFLALRLHILGADASVGVGKQVLFNSCSAYMRTAAQNCKAAPTLKSVALPVPAITVTKAPSTLGAGSSTTGFPTTPSVAAPITSPGVRLAEPSSFVTPSRCQATVPLPPPTPTQPSTPVRVSITTESTRSTPTVPGRKVILRRLLM